MSARLGTAEWADPAFVEQKYRYREGCVFLGRAPTEAGLPVGYRDDRHVCLVSGSRGGKGTSSIINNLCLWPSSIVVLDPKGENATITAPRRGKGSPRCEGLGQTVHVLDPFKCAQVAPEYRSRFNPLDTLNPQSEEAIDEAGRIADAIVVIHETNDPFWDESARLLVKGLILHIISAPEYEGRRNLVTLRAMVTRGDWESVEALRESGETDIPSAHGLLWTGLRLNDAFNGLVAGIGDTFTNMLLSSPKQYESVLQVANRNTEFIDSPAMQRCLEASDLKLADLKLDPKGMSLYLCLPQRYMSTHYRWLRMMIALVVTEMEIVRGRPAAGAPVLMLLDEFAGLKRMEVIESSVAQLAGFSVKMFFVLQSLEQLKAVYKDNWETFLSNSGLRIFFSLEDHFSREYVSKLIGDTEIIREMHSDSDSESESHSTSHSVGETRSESRTLSKSRGTSLSEGTNRSTSKSQSGGVNSSRSSSTGASTGKSWVPGFFFWDNNSKSEGKNWSQSSSEGTSRGWSLSDSSGVSKGRSVSDTKGESVTVGTSRTETWGETEGTSTSHTRGMNETVHRRALIAPDEIGQLFARIDDTKQRAYPGMALIVVSGEHAIALRRVNYFEDYQFIRRFEPHPDFPTLLESGEVAVTGEGVTPYTEYMGMSKLDFPECLAVPDQVVSRGARIVRVDGNGTVVGHVTAPYTGLITSAVAKDKTAGEDLFSLRYFETGEPLADPFADVAAAAERYTARLREKLKSAVFKFRAGAAGGIFFVVLAIALKQFGWLIGAAAGGVFAFLGSNAAADIKSRLARYPKNRNADLGIRHLSGTAAQPSTAPPATPPVAESVPEPVVARTAAESNAVIEKKSAKLIVPEDTEPAVVQLPEPVAKIPSPGPDVPATPAKNAAIPDSTATEMIVAAHAEPRVIAPPHAVEGPSLVKPADEETTFPVSEQAREAAFVRTAATVPASSSQRANFPAPSPSFTDRLLVSFRLWHAALVAVAVIVLVVIFHNRHYQQTTGISDSSASVRQRETQTTTQQATLPDPPSEKAAVPADQPSVVLSRTMKQGGLEALTFVNAHELATLSFGDGLELWDATSGIEVRKVGDGHIRSMAFSKNGRLSAFADYDGRLTLQDADSGAEIRTLQGHAEADAIAFSADEKLLGTGNEDGTISLWDVTTGVELHRIVASSRPVASIVFSPDGRLFASSSDTVRTWDSGTGAPIHVFSPSGDGPGPIAFSPDGRFLAAGVNRTIQFWDAATGKQQGTLVGHTHEVLTVAFSPDSKLIASGGNDYIVKLWDVATQVELRQLPPNKKWVCSVVFSPDGRQLATGTGDGIAKLWNIRSAN